MSISINQTYWQGQWAAIFWQYLSGVATTSWKRKQHCKQTLSRLEVYFTRFARTSSGCSNVNFTRFARTS